MAKSTQQYIGVYRLLSMIRAGKTCEVWEAMRDTSGQKFALKVLQGEYAKDRVERGYLQHEFAVGQGLDHPNVIHIYDLGMNRNSCFLAMELCQVLNLKQLLQQGVEALQHKLPKIIEEAAAGLSRFHAHGWVHRDIKPDNFLLDVSGDVKLIDFALARRINRGWRKLLPSFDKSVQGTRSYMSPEQIRSHKLDERADIYSFGCMVYELLGGKPPFTGASSNDLLTKHLNAQAPSVQAANRNVTESFANLVKKMLAKKPQSRPQNMDEFLLEMRSAPIFKEPPPVPRK